jgi:ribonucleoside-diphosphate reductase alpha chain
MMNSKEQPQAMQAEQAQAQQAPQDKEMKVIKRDGQYEEVSFDKILRRVKKIGSQANPPLTINYSQLVMKVIDQLYDNIPTHIIDELTAEQCASMCTKHTDYSILASRIIVSNSHKNTVASFYEAMKKLYNFIDVHGKQAPLIDEKLWSITEQNKEKIENMIDYERDYLFDYFGFKTLERAYLMRIDKTIIERPQHMWMRVALAIHGQDFDLVKETYAMLSQKYFIHATPTLFNAGTPRPQLSSCYLISMEDDSIEGIYNTLKDCAKISKWAGGIGLHIHNVRATGSHIKGTNGTSNGIVPMLRVFNMTARYVDQGGGKRNGSFAIYLEPWHADVEDFLELKKNHGDEEMRARDLFFALWIPSLFMEKVKNNEDWGLFCPHKCPGLADCYGEDFRTLYEKYMKEGKALKVVKARDLWFKILDSQMETGTPYLLYKDAANEKSNQKNIGVIKSSNLCTEIIEYSDKDQTAVCNLASIALNKFVLPDKTFDYEHLHKVTKIITANLDKIISINFYPTDKTKTSNILHRPIGIGVQGLADTFALMDIPFHSEDAKLVNKYIFETIYHAALERSNEISKERLEGMREIKLSRLTRDTDLGDRRGLGFETDYINGLIALYEPIKEELNNLQDNHLGAYSSFEGSPAAKGILQFDMWKVDPTKHGRYDWVALKESIMTYGLRNSLLLAPMPTASTSQILGNNECFEPFTSNIYSRRTLAGDFVIPNKYLMNELAALGLWNEEIKDNIILNKGSIQHIECIPQKIKDKYKIVWEIPMKHVIDMAADRGAFICQSQSLNLWMEDPDYKALTSMHFYSWQAGLKTGIYYLRRKPKHQPQQFTIAPVSNVNSEKEEICEMCSS